MSVTDSLTTGSAGTATVIVTDALLATAVGSGNAPVYASPSMIALMEAAAVACVEDKLPDGFATLGSELEVSHRAPTPRGLTVTATATLADISGRKLTFDVRAHDGIEEIGRGHHVRIIVDNRRFLERVAAKAPTE